MQLFHLSEDPAITVFHPRPSDYAEGPVVWAIDESRLVNYLLPRQCPRICFRAGAQSTPSDVAQFLGADSVVIAIEAAWLRRLQAAQLQCYGMPAASFRLQDAGAGYWVSDQAVAGGERARRPARCHCRAGRDAARAAIAVGIARRRSDVEPGILADPNAECRGEIGLLPLHQPQHRIA